MTRVQTLELKTNRVDGDAEGLRWSLSWLPDDHSESFTREAILAYAPATSGVYGLFNFDCQVFIGEAANIQEALLRHQEETNFQSQHLKPTGFTFEPCAPELRRAKAEALIAKFHPVLQTEAALNESCAESYRPEVKDVSLGMQELEKSADHQEFPAQDYEKQPSVRPVFQFIGTRGAAFVLMLAATAIAIFFLGMPTDDAIQKRANGANRPSGQNDTTVKMQNKSPIDTAMTLGNQSAAAMPAKPVPASSSTPKAAAAEVSVEPMQTIPIASKDNIGASKKWSVQISAAAVKAVAEAMVQQLIADGYDGYVVQAEVKGQNYYRVRVGRFDKREEAESMRHTLAQQEDYRDAFLTSD